METLSFYERDWNDDYLNLRSVSRNENDIQELFEHVDYMINNSKNKNDVDFANMYETICHGNFYIAKSTEEKENLSLEIQDKMNFIQKNLQLSKELAELHYWKEIITWTCRTDLFVLNDFVRLVNQIEKLEIMRDVIDPIMASVVATLYNYRNKVLGLEPLFEINIKRLNDSKYLTQEQKYNLQNAISQLNN